jgi:hypothetical protein
VTLSTGTLVSTEPHGLGRLADGQIPYSYSPVSQRDISVTLFPFWELQCNFCNASFKVRRQALISSQENRWCRVLWALLVLGGFQVGEWAEFRIPTDDTKTAMVSAKVRSAL